MNLLLYMSPIAVVLLLPAALIMEPNVIDVTLALGKEHKFMGVLLLLNSAAAYAANLTNFLVTKHTSALTLQVLGNAKGVVAVVISILIFRNPVTFIGMAGYAVTVMGVVAYGETKRRPVVKSMGKNLDFRAAVQEERAARDLLKSKRKEMDSVQSTMNRLNNAISVGDIDSKIRNMEHMIQHETLPLKEEKQLIRVYSPIKS
ncbi:hypothetical protein RYX36_031059 [Vicia faba]